MEPDKIVVSKYLPYAKASHTHSRNDWFKLGDLYSHASIYGIFYFYYLSFLDIVLDPDEKSGMKKKLLPFIIDNFSWINNTTEWKKKVKSGEHSQL